MSIISYTPSRTCEAFIKSEARQNWMIGPVGGGKTVAGLQKIIYHATRQAPSPIDGIRRSKVAVIRNSYAELKDTTIRSFLAWYKDGEAGKWMATDKNFLLRFGDVECEIQFRPMDTPDDIGRVLSLEVTFIMLDEFVKIPQSMLRDIAARAGRYPAKIHGGATYHGIWGTSNADTEDNPWFEYLYTTVPTLPPNVAAYFEQPSGVSPQAENIENLPETYYQDLIAGAKPEWIKQFIDCRWGYTLRGKPVVPAFSDSIHVAKAPLRYNPAYPLVIGYDPGVASAMIIGQCDMYDRLLVLDELCQRDYSAKRLISDRLMPLLRAKYPGAQVIVAPDPNANNRSQATDTTVVDELRKKFNVQWQTNNQLAVRLAALDHYVMRVTETGPALVIDPGCKTLIRALGGGWCYEQQVKTGSTKPEPDKNNPYSHPGDALCYLARHFTAASDKMKRRDKFPGNILRQQLPNYHMR